ncbi:unnamed protein product [Aphanomyces euteiches]
MENFHVLHTLDELATTAHLGFPLQKLRPKSQAMAAKQSDDLVFDLEDLSDSSDSDWVDVASSPINRQSKRPKTSTSASDKQSNTTDLNSPSVSDEEYVESSIVRDLYGPSVKKLSKEFTDKVTLVDDAQTQKSNELFEASGECFEGVSNAIDKQTSPAIKTEPLDDLYSDLDILAIRNKLESSLEMNLSQEFTWKVSLDQPIKPSIEDKGSMISVSERDNAQPKIHNDVKMMNDYTEKKMDVASLKEECSLCEDLVDILTRLPACDHGFCLTCMFRWVFSIKDCPICLANAPVKISYTCCYECSSFVDSDMTSTHFQFCGSNPATKKSPEKIFLDQLIASSSLTCRGFLMEFIMAPLPLEVRTIRCSIESRGRGFRLMLGKTFLCAAVQYPEIDRRVCHSFYRGDLDECKVARMKRNAIGSEYTIQNVQDNTSLGAVQYTVSYQGTGRQIVMALPSVTKFGDSGWTIDTRRDTMLDVLDEYGAPDSIHLLNKPRPPRQEFSYDDYGNPIFSDDGIKTPPVTADFNYETHDEELQRDLALVAAMISASQDTPPTCATSNESVSKSSCFEMVTVENMDTSVLEFGRGQLHHEDYMSEYYLEFSHPLSPLQAFAIALSSMDSSLGEDDVHYFVVKIFHL